QKVPFPCVISGQCPGGDVDHYLFTVKKGQHVVVETEAARLGSGVLPQIRVLDARQQLLASDDTQKLRGDCRLSFIAPADGDYVVEFSDTRYRGGNPPHYRLRIADYDVIEAVFPLGGRRGVKREYFVFPAGASPADAAAPESRSVRPKRGVPPRAWPLEGLRLIDLPASIKPGTPPLPIAGGKYHEVVRLSPCGEKGNSMSLEPPVTANGFFLGPQEVHFYEMAVRPGQRWRFRVEAESLGSHLDAVLRLTDGGKKQLA